MGFEFKSEPFSLIVLRIKQADWAVLRDELDAKLAKTPGFFDHDPVVTDLAAISEQTDSIDFNALRLLLARHGACTVAVRNGSITQQEAALKAGFGILRSGQISGEAKESGTNPPEQVAAVTAAVEPDPPAPAGHRIINKPIRTGQQSYARQGDLIAMDMVSAGGEVLADGNIHVYGPLRGRALAGIKGDRTARIFTRSLEAELVSIAGIYRTFEHDWAKEYHGKPVQIFLDGDKLMISPL
ncbi:septum site-determining protein MinC [Chitinivorax tropicus]|uniref:Probable septum site-determining protein MinC n=1 Tax=Chitinivorax tropicus TaxID=714531 RepID=A0A840MQ05_9PROT|nr:septum site-determining protein MinC [Chitinivorax tropicus]MBB5019169.1 septum site-determining protein MinC [Chitinivorax tropicus]